MRPRLLCAALAAFTPVALLPLATPAGAGYSARAAFVVDTNDARYHHERPQYAVRDHLQRVAQRWAEWMAAHQTLRHNPYLESQVRNWSALGENVGRGSGESSIQRAFMESDSHRSNILSWTFRQVGVGVARGADGKLYVDEVFRRPQ